MGFLRITLVALILSLALSLTSCSPFYIVRAGYEEASILLHRQPIDKVIVSETTSAEEKRKLTLVLETRQFTKELGLIPKKSFTKYTKINRDVLVWVLSASPKDSLSAYTWWFPIVGRVPYKGFFSKDSAVKAAKSLKEKNLDIYLRPSPAFSTLGWFNDPLLSTTLAFNDIDLIDTVIHEIFHNTVWVKNHVSFNETAANLVGALGAIEFTEQKYGKNSKQAKQARLRLQAQLQFSKFLDKSLQKINEFYAEAKKTKSFDLERRELIFSEIAEEWQISGNLYYQNAVKNLNNALIIAYQIYLANTEKFMRLYRLSDSSMINFIEKLNQISLEAEQKDVDPFKLLNAELSELKSS